MRPDLFPFQERGHGWLRLLGDLRVGGILADDMGLGKTVQAIATIVSERDGRRGGRADAGRQPDERRAAVGAGDRGEKPDGVVEQLAGCGDAHDLEQDLTHLDPSTRLAGDDAGVDREVAAGDLVDGGGALENAGVRER